ncbi:MAG: polyprenyl synthetase family protein [Pseudomonadota bacterium]
MSGQLGEIEALTCPASRHGDQSALVTEMVTALSEMPEIRSAGDESAGDIVNEAMRYSLRLRGKRARGLLVLLIANGWEKPWKSASDCAQAIEMVHTASLIIDDLPSMDNANTRRGEPTNHAKYGEPTAVLAGIALLSEALRILAASSQLSAQQRNQAVVCLASAIGPTGMSAGQMRDISPPEPSLANVELTHALKTGTLFAAAAELGCIAAGVDGPRKWMLSDFGMLLGKAFQEFDDLIDVSTAAQDAGKDTQKDEGKPTVVGLLGRDAAMKRALRQIAMALDCLEASRIQVDEIRRYTLDLTKAMRTVIGVDSAMAGKDT